jgi:KEOPS complex subunit Cgi121
MTSLKEQITIIGFKNVEIQNINTFLERFRNEKTPPIQFFNAKHIAGSQHIFFATLNALNSFNKKKNISNNLAVEVLLYASGQRQITKAVNMLGIKQDSSEVAVLIFSENCSNTTEYLKLVTNAISGERDDDVLELTNKKCVIIKKLFEISDLEFEAKLQKEGQEKEALIDLVIERMAILGIKC